MLCVFVLLSSCKNSPKTFTLTGRVISKQPETQQLIIDNDDIPGFMGAMTMPYAVKDSRWISTGPAGRCDPC